MDLLIKIASPITVRRNEEDVIDRLNFQYTSYVYVFAALLISSKQYMGSAIECWTPAEFRRGWIEYARDYCLIENTYWVPLDDPDLPTKGHREAAELPYYQWVQFVLVLMAFCFMVPHFIWRSLNWQTGVQVRSIVNTCVSTMATPAERRDVVRKVAEHLNHSFDVIRHSSKTTRLGLLQRVGKNHTVTLLYVFMKILFIVNIFGQLIVLHFFLGFNPLFAFQEGWNSDWKRSGLFPRSTMCDFEVRTKGNVQRYSVQCVLSLNMFNEKIFSLLFVWLTILLCATMFNLLAWLRTVYVSSNRRDLAVRLLRSQGVVDPGRSAKLVEYETTDASISRPLLDEHAVNTYHDFIDLTPDQATILRLIAANAGDIVSGHVAKEMYELQRKM